MTLTIQELIDELLQVPENERHLKIYAFQEDLEVELLRPTLYDGDEPHSETNSLSMTLQWAV